MLTVVPKKEFDELNKKVSEAEPKKQKFNYEDFKKEVMHYSMVNDYLKDKLIEFVGKGSGRTAYLIPKGGCVGHEDFAVCLKVANNVRGIAQNEGEILTIENYGGKDEPCFPELFGYDLDSKISLMCEIGRKVQGQPEFTKYFREWNLDCIPKFSKQTLENIPRNQFNDLKIEIPDDVFGYLKAIKKIKRTGNAGKEIVNEMLDDFKKVAKKYKKYEPFVSIFVVMFEKDAVYEVSLGDFGEIDNWAFVNRNGQEVLVPIDWGLTEEVKYQYYV